MIYRYKKYSVICVRDVVEVVMIAWELHSVAR